MKPNLGFSRPNLPNKGMGISLSRESKAHCLCTTTNRRRLGEFHAMTSKLDRAKCNQIEFNKLEDELKYDVKKHGVK